LQGGKCPHLPPSHKVEGVCNLSLTRTAGVLKSNLENT